MPITSLSGIGNVAQQGIQRVNDRLQSAIASLVTGRKLNRASDDVAALSIATQLQTALSSLREVSGNVAQASSLLQVADGGAEEIGGLVQELRDLALQAKSPTLSPANRATLNQQFQELAEEINRIAGNTTFNNRTLLDGSVSGEDSLSIGSVLSGEEGGEEGVTLAIDNLSTDSLFGGQSLSILTADGATQALDILSTALGKVTEARADIGAFQQSLGFIAANIDSAVANQDAARSVLQDTDFAEQSTIYSLLNVQRDAGLALAAQTNRLTPGVLQLLE